MKIISHRQRLVFQVKPPIITQSAYTLVFTIHEPLLTYGTHFPQSKTGFSSSLVGPSYHPPSLILCSKMNLFNEKPYHSPCFKHQYRNICPVHCRSFAQWDPPPPPPQRYVYTENEWTESDRQRWHNMRYMYLSAHSRVYGIWLWMWQKHTGPTLHVGPDNNE